MAERRMLAISGGVLETWSGGAPNLPAPLVCAAHPAAAFGKDTVALLQDMAHAHIVCVNPRGLGASSAGSAPGPGNAALEQMVDDIEAARIALGLGAWVFWGMSGGGWLGQIYAKRYPDALAGLILESICACFLARLADPACVLSPRHAAWRDALAAAGLAAREAAPRVPDPSELEWLEVAKVGSVLRVRGGPALLVSPMVLSPEMRQIMPALIAVDTRAWLPSVAVPTLVLCGSADPIVPLAHARAVHEAIAGSEFVEIGGAGHVPTSERHPQVAAAVGRFLAELQ